MKATRFLTGAGIMSMAIAAIAQQAQPARHWAIVVHGGAGVIERAGMKPETEAAYRASMKQATEGGAKVLDNGGSSLDAIEAVIHILEDDPLFNAGRGAVAGVTRTRHPISLARAVMDKSPHVMLIGAGADEFAAQVGLEQVDPSFFFTERRWQSLIKQLKKEGRR